MSEAHGKTKNELGRTGTDPHVDDTEGTPHEDTWYGRGSHGWFHAPLYK